MSTEPRKQIVIATDFGLEGPYIGQVKSVLDRRAPGVAAIDLFSDLPPFDPRPAAYLIAAYAKVFGPGAIFLCVVDPGVGSDRAPIAVKADGQWFVGPDNGLFEPVIRRAGMPEVFAIANRYGDLSASFHGRDLFAPFAADLAQGHVPDDAARIDPARIVRPDWPDDLAEIVYIDRFGNCMTGLRADCLGEGERLRVGDTVVQRARTFADVPHGAPFWYVNSNGLIEIATNRSRADRRLGVEIGAPVDKV